MKGLCWIYVRLAGRVLLNRKHAYLMQSLWSVLQSMKTDTIPGSSELFQNFQDELKK